MNSLQMGVVYLDFAERKLQAIVQNLNWLGLLNVHLKKAVDLFHKSVEDSLLLHILLLLNWCKLCNIHEYLKVDAAIRNKLVRNKIVICGVFSRIFFVTLGFDKAQ